MEHSEALPPELEQLADADVFHYGHLPLVAAFCRQLGLQEAVNETVPSKMELKPGSVVQAVVLDTLCGRTPLYRLEESLEEQDLGVLLGQGVEAHNFNDTNLGRSLDAIFEAGPAKILTELGGRAVRIFNLDARVVSYDTTSTSVWGDYLPCAGSYPPPGPIITHGHSKDKRPDLKQFMTELLCVERGVPIFGRILNGNSSDKTSNNTMLTKLSKLMATHGLGPGDFIYVADSAMVTEKNLATLDVNRFVSRLPANYAACGKAIATAVDAGEWKDIGALAEYKGTKNRPNATYRIASTEVELHGREYRAVVVHSDSHDRRRRKKLEKALTQSREQIKKEIKKIPVVYSCEPDALEACKRVQKLSGQLHHAKASVVSFQKRKRGRPPKNGPAPTATQYQLKCDICEKVEAVERERELAGCFVLISNVPKEGPGAVSAKGLLQTYKGQYGVESGFTFLKDPLVVNDTFLKKPKRIEVLGTILVIALLIWRLMERSMRASIANTDKTLPGWENRRTKRPTTFMASTAMHGITVIRTAQGQRFLIRKPTAKQEEYLRAMGLTASVFVDPSSKCKPIIPSEPRSKG